jgi:hypothetical protein
MPKQVMFSDEGRGALLREVNVMTAAVKATPCPRGHWKRGRVARWDGRCSLDAVMDAKGGPNRESCLV